MPSPRCALAWLFPRPAPSGFSLERPPLTPPAKVPPSWSPVLQLLRRTYLSISLFLKFFWLPWIFVGTCRLPLVAARGNHSSLWSAGSRRTGYRSCGTETLLPRGVWDLSGSGTEPVSPALADGFLTIRPPGKSPGCFFTCFIAGFPKHHLSSMRAGTSSSLSLHARGHILGRRINESIATIQEGHFFISQVCPKHPL